MYRNTFKGYDNFDIDWTQPYLTYPNPNPNPHPTYPNPFPNLNPTTYFHKYLLILLFTVALSPLYVCRYMYM